MSWDWSKAHWQQGERGMKSLSTGNVICDMGHEPEGPYSDGWRPNECMSDEFFAVRPTKASTRLLHPDDRYEATREVHHRYGPGIRHGTWIERLGYTRTQREAKALCLARMVELDAERIKKQEIGA